MGQAVGPGGGGTAPRISYARQAGTAPISPAVQNFASRYENAMKEKPHLKARMAARLQDFERLAASQDATVVDYSDKVFARLDDDLKGLHDVVETADPADRAKLADILGDLLLTGSLVPTRRGRGDAQQFSIEVMNHDRLRDMLRDVEFGLRGTNRNRLREQLDDIKLRDGDTLEQRMLELSLLNLKPEAAEALRNDALFQKIRDSPYAGTWMLAASGADEQRFLNTCAASAVNQGILADVSSIAGLLHAGRSVTRNLEADLARYRNNPEKDPNPQVVELLQRRIDQAKASFDDIESRAHQMLDSGAPPDFDAVHALTRDWGRVMQKLAGVSDATTATRTPHLTKKDIDDHWHLSALLAILQLKMFHRPLNRVEGIDVGKYRDNVETTIKTGLRITGREVDGNLAKWIEQGNSIDTYWTELLHAGGTHFSVTGHSLYMKAVRDGDEEVFLVGDPMVSYMQRMTKPEMVAYARRKHVTVPEVFVPG